MAHCNMYVCVCAYTTSCCVRRKWDMLSSDLQVTSEAEIATAASPLPTWRRTAKMVGNSSRKKSVMVSSIRCLCLSVWPLAMIDQNVDDVLH